LVELQNSFQDGDEHAEEGRDSAEG
jgi:hypothetical protein